MGFVRVGVVVWGMVAGLCPGGWLVALWWGVWGWCGVLRVGGFAGLI